MSSKVYVSEMSRSPKLSHNGGDSYTHTQSHSSTDHNIADNSADSDVVDTESSALVSSTAREGSQSHTEATAMSRFYSFLNSMRRLSGLIVVWNVFFIILMLFVFRS